MSVRYARYPLSITKPPTWYGGIRKGETFPDASIPRWWCYRACAKGVLSDRLAVSRHCMQVGQAFAIGMRDRLSNMTHQLCNSFKKAAP